MQKFGTGPHFGMGLFSHANLSGICHDIYAPKVFMDSLIDIVTTSVASWNVNLNVLANVINWTTTIYHTLETASKCSRKYR